MPDFVFYHEFFIHTVRTFYEYEKNKQTSISKEKIDYILSGRPTDTCTFILICNEVGISPNVFFKNNTK